MIHDLSAVWNTDAPPGQAWQCPDCASWATLGGNAAFHANKMKHGTPVLVPMPRKTTQQSMNTTLKHVAHFSLPETITPGALLDGLKKLLHQHGLCRPYFGAGDITESEGIFIPLLSGHELRVHVHEDPAAPSVDLLAPEPAVVPDPFRAELERRVEAARSAADEALNRLQPDDAIMATELRATRWEVRESHLGLTGALAQGNVEIDPRQAVHDQTVIRRYIRLRAALAEV